MKALTDTAITISLCNTGTWRLILRAFKRLFNVPTLQKDDILSIHVHACLIKPIPLMYRTIYSHSSIHLFIYLFIYSFTYLFNHSFIHLLIYLSIYLFHILLYNTNSWTHTQPMSPHVYGETASPHTDLHVTVKRGKEGRGNA